MSLKHPVLAQVALGYAPLYDKQRQVLATRLSLIPLKPDTPPDAAALLLAALEALPPDHRPGVLNLPHEAALGTLLAAPLPPHLAVEVPAFMAGQFAAQLQAHSGLLLKGTQPLGPALSAFKCTELDLDDLRRGVTDPNKLPLWCNVVKSGREADEAFQRSSL
jgi:c-di-GMP phosphodiesterase